ncbi:MAG TPA: hypothetical protein VJ846_12910, partial [Sphingomicrobium sp.]|nr:hypothetical protein [Sphingomicrobium sp.]
KQVESAQKQVESAVAPAAGVQLMQPETTAPEPVAAPGPKAADAIGKGSEPSSAGEQTPPDRPA